MKRVAVVFPGQGSQSLGMLSAYGDVLEVKKAVDEASRAIDVDLAHIIENDEVALNQTINTQPTILAVSVGVYRSIRDNVIPVVFSGHSLGEYSALVCAEALSLSNAVRLVRRRAIFMQEAVSDGAMAALLGIGIDTVNDICIQCRDEGESIWVANYNSEKQIVIAGLKSSIENRIDLFKSRGAKRVVMLPMSVPSHCPLLHLAADKLKEEMQKIEWKMPKVPIVHTVKVDTPDIIETMAAQLVALIRWPDVLQEIATTDADIILECGPGKVLTGLGKGFSIPHVPLNNSSSVVDFLS